MHNEHTRLRGFIRRPTADQVAELAKKEFLDLSAEDAKGYAEVMDDVLSLFDRLDALAQPVVELRHRARDPGRVPTAEDDPFNSFTRLCDVPGAEDGPLAGLRVAVKDNIAVAGVPTSNASRTAAVVPTEDAVLVERILDAGGRIIGKLNMDDFGAAGTGEHSFRGPARNPFDTRRSAGGSSSGAGSSVAAGQVDLAIGVDQGGSARIPASFCGAVSLKATHGLIPSHGVGHIDHTLDYACPVAGSVRLVATAADAISGHDWRDPQWVRAAPQPTRCVEALDRGISDLKIGIIEESVSEELCERGVLEGFERAREAAGAAGADISKVSIPLWNDAWAIEVVTLCIQGWAMAQSEGVGFGNLGLVDIQAAHSYALTRRLEANEFPPFLKVWLLVGRYIHDYYYGTYLGKVQNLRLSLRQQVDSALADYDLFMTPTTPHSAPLMPESPVGDFELLRKATTMTANVAPLNLTAHPAIAVPSGLDGDGLPVSVQFIGRHFEDPVTVSAAAVIESALGIPSPNKSAT